MTHFISRRGVLGGILAAASWQAAAAAVLPGETLYDMPFPDELDAGFDPALLPPAESEIDHPVEAADLDSIPREFHRQMVAYEGDGEPGSIIVDPDRRHLTLILPEFEAMRYGVGVGRAGFAWSGAALVGMKRRWPRWLPPREMVSRDKNAAKWANGQPGGPDNPLGARALYLHQDGKDTLYRIHGTNDPKSIGKAMSSGCVRLLNQDIADLYERVPVGTPVLVLPSSES